MEVVCVEAVAEYFECVVAGGEGVAQIGTGACGVVAVSYFSIAEVEEYVFVVDG